MKYISIKGRTVADMPMARLLSVCVSEPPPGQAIKADDMRARIRVLDAIDAAGDVLALEDADAALMQRCVAQMTWKVVHRDIVRFCDDVANLASEPPPSPPPPEPPTPEA